jgi:hypothetical protein
MPLYDDAADVPPPDQKLIDALNTALAHIEGRRHIFSTRDPKTVAGILRQALGDRVNEDRGKDFGPTTP